MSKEKRKADARGYSCNTEHISRIIESVLHKRFNCTFLLSSFLFISILISCNESFEPFEEDDQFFFSIYGFLDASADTQRVRIAPVRNEFNMLETVPEMTVQLEDLETGAIETMSQTLVQFGQGFNAINVWTDMKVFPEKSYRLSARTADGKVSEVRVTTPKPFPIPKLLTQSVPGFPTEYFLFIDEIENVADVQSRWHYRVSTPYWEEERFRVFSLRSEVEKINSALGDYVVELIPELEKQLIRDELIVLIQPDGQIEFLENQIFIASAGPEWDPNISGIDDLVYFLPDGFSNVTNGLGYMVGIFSRNIPFQTCINERRELTGCPEVNPFF